MNWKYILIIVILAAVVGGGILIYQYWWVEKPPVKVSPGPTDETLDETFCNKDDDCVITGYTYDCCGASCSGVIINKQAFEKRRQWTISHCTSEDYEKCPLVNCESVDEKAICKNNKCTRIGF